MTQLKGFKVIKITLKHSVELIIFRTFSFFGITLPKLSKNNSLRYILDIYF
jgi:hypothetical protein